MMKGSSFKDFVLDQLQTLGQMEARAMFGGYGLYADSRFFGIIFTDRLYFKTTSGTATVYRARGMRPFRPNAKQTLTSYYEVPVDIIEDDDALVAWARQAVNAAARRRSSATLGDRVSVRGRDVRDGMRPSSSGQGRGPSDAGRHAPRHRVPRHDRAACSLTGNLLQSIFI